MKQSALEHWVARIAINTCINQIKAEKIRPELRWADLSEEEQFAVATLASEADGAATDAEAAREIVEVLLARLEPQDRLLMTLLHLEERPGKEVAQMLGWSHVREFRARQKLKRQFRNLMKDRTYE